MALDIQKKFGDQINEFIEQGVAVAVPTLAEIDPKGHISEEVLSRLVIAIEVGNPKEWMSEYLDNEIEFPIDTFPPEFQEFYRGFSERELAEIKACTSLMTQIANVSRLSNEDFQRANPEIIAKFKTLYKLAEMRIMYFIKNKIKDLINEGLPEGESKDPKKVLNLFALRGAKVFENQYNFGVSKEVEMKRIPLLDGSYVVGVGPEFQQLLDMPLEEKAMVEDVILPDDCISTGMSEGALVKLLKMAGFNPKRIIIPATVAVRGGLAYIAKIVKETFPDCTLSLPAGEPCSSVNDLMYLMVKKLFKVGDMGFFNYVASNEDLANVPTGETPMNTNMDLVKLAFYVTDPEGLLRYLEHVTNQLFSTTEA
ncbi:MAG: hypothetical protein ABI721_04130 [Candidatus Dojkabacteria bacterium]